MSFIFSIKNIKGYVNPVTNLAPTPKNNTISNGTCTPFPFQFSVPDQDIEPKLFKATLSTADTFNSTVDLYAIASNAGDLEVKIDSQTQGPLVFRNSAFTIRFENLSPGTQYRMMLKRPQGTLASQIVTTKCFCEKIGSDTTGVPKSAYSVQENGFVMFVFTDNSQ
jgi:hypothetical protein